MTNEQERRNKTMDPLKLIADAADIEERIRVNDAETSSAQAPVEHRKARQLVGSGDVVVLSAEDIRNLKEAAGRRGYAVPRFNPRTGTRLSAQWESWQKLQRKRLADIEGSGEAEDLVITPAGRMALRRHNTGYEPRP